MRHYGDSYSDSLTSDISSVRFSVDTTSYSSGISATSVQSNRQWIKDECKNAATSAYDRVYLIRSKLDHLRSVLSTFYGEVETTGLSVHNISASVSSALADVNTAMTNLHDVLAEVGSYRGTTATPASICAACAPLTNAGVTMSTYYATTFSNPDGSLNQEAVNSYFEEYDALIADGSISDLAYSYRTNGLILATDHYLALNDYSDAAYTNATNILMTGMLIQDYDAPSSTDDVFYYDDEDTRLAYISYRFRDSADYFVNSYNAILQYNYIAYGYGNNLNDMDPTFVNNLQMCNILGTLTRCDYISVPVELSGSYMQEHAIDPENYMPLTNASHTVEVPFPANFTIETADTHAIMESMNSTFEPDSAVNISYNCNTSNGTINHGFYLYDVEDSYGTLVVDEGNNNFLQSTCVVTGDPTIGALCDEASYQVSEAYMNSNIQNISGWDYAKVFVPIVGTVGEIEGAWYDNVTEDGYAPNAIEAYHAGRSQYNSITGSPLLAPANYLQGVAQGMLDIRETEERNDQINAMVDQQEENRTNGNYFDNVGSYGSYYYDTNIQVDGSTSTSTIHPVSSMPNQSMMDPWEAQTRLGYQQSTSHSDSCQVYDPSDPDVMESLEKPGGNAASYDQWRDGMETHYSNTHNGRSVTELSQEEYVAYIEEYNEFLENDDDGD